MSATRAGRPVVFLDRDGTLIEEREYLADPAGVRFLDGAPGALRRLQDAGFALVVVTNQSGIARGLYGEEAYESVARRVEDDLAGHGVRVDGTYHCPHHPDFTGVCTCRKPGVALHRQAARELGLDLARSFCVGDKVADVVAAHVLGGRGILVRTGYGVEHEAILPGGLYVADDLAAAADMILELDSGGDG